MIIKNGRKRNPLFGIEKHFTQQSGHLLHHPIVTQEDLVIPHQLSSCLVWLEFPFKLGYADDSVDEFDVVFGRG